MILQVTHTHTSILHIHTERVEDIRMAGQREEQVLTQVEHENYGFALPSPSWHTQHEVNHWMTEAFAWTMIQEPCWMSRDPVTSGE